MKSMIMSRNERIFDVVVGVAVFLIICYAVYLIL